MKPDLSDSLTAAKNLLGWKLVHKSSEGVTSGYIVETEAYDMADPASHSYGGMRVRNAPMYEAAGMVYVYFTYGMHYCMNIVTGSKGHGQAVLIRALEPVAGIELMKKRRGIDGMKQLANGPAKLAQAMGIDRSLNGVRLEENGLFLESGVEVGEVVQTTRIGISKAVDHPWRFYIAGSPYVSKR
jgi:DNA-3-methyladenine glycosylase